MKKSLLTVSAVLIFSGCASSQPKVDIASINLDNAVNEDGEKLYCTREAITGSHMKTTTCLTQAQKDAARRDSDAYVTKLKLTPEFKGESGG